MLGCRTSIPRFEHACPIAGGMCAGAEAFHCCKRTTKKAGESDMRSYTRFRKRFGAARSRVLGRLLPSILILAALLVALFPPARHIGHPLRKAKRRSSRICESSMEGVEAGECVHQAGPLGLGITAQDEARSLLAAHGSCGDLSGRRQQPLA